jgi:hypothetical protein
MYHALATALFLLGAVLGQAPAIDWQTDLAAATKLAGERRAPLFVVFRCER